jgi:hypothetical protein
VKEKEIGMGIEVRPSNPEPGEGFQSGNKRRNNQEGVNPRKFLAKQIARALAQEGNSASEWDDLELIVDGRPPWKRSSKNSDPQD